MTRTRRVVGLHILPSSMTVLAICAGLTSIKFALDHETQLAMAMIAAAAILDGLDGRVARLLDASSRMGEEIDSLADAVNFGVAPAVVVYVTMLASSPAGWIAALLYAVCIVLRLARFNTLLDETELPAYTREYFVGMPAPAGAIAVIAPLAAFMQFQTGWWTAEWFVCAWLVFCAALVISRIPMRKMHAVSVPPRLVSLVLAGLTMVAAAAFLFPYILILLLVGAYLLHIPFGVRSHRWVAARPENWEDKPREWRAARRAIRRAGPNRRSMTRLGLRKPGR
ncbi:CDP-diacylglycerol--serine O-phosphatidyltransferase [Mycolicibacillus parakoreensis]|uniref:CDP-diacylglycerol--serine O-phosphatidyltransferase n=1 Tax=Mycolicibacillus parakoreensis TaxID=1069221 RepID=A0ABY3TXG4_9MYCO|nr:CDP-diacylglycerol--serine O-phosphatidyltransferase [Mycolicibacillus parakoreensis]MCV7315966.1 CDP-diacylglycerol--serine O-phosphatidyltransferase [Mycolicibacillus parakoreensis]ULN52402.1 CDP-diacylglycerol--serine O-phosphatidyltransferase [Mycolicibacillus parakoreensis]HLR98944.1 CDP-diacylglycerol--serine O-phosphatidyltransferase [Mycolicibacillus parakoreensis]